MVVMTSKLGLNLRLKKLALEKAREIYSTCMQTDFPPEEIKPFAVIEKMWKAGSYFAYGFYEEGDKGIISGQQEDAQLCAYAFLLANKEEQVLLLDYFAVCRHKRGNGYGSCALSLLQGECADWSALVIEVEDDETALEETVQKIRRRRISFYTHAGCIMTGTRSRVWGVDYRIMALPLKDRRPQEDMAKKVTALYGGMYGEEDMKKHFKMTAL